MNGTDVKSGCWQGTCMIADGQLLMCGASSTRNMDSWVVKNVEVASFWMPTEWLEVKYHSEELLLNIYFHISVPITIGKLKYAMNRL